MKLKIVNHYWPGINKYFKEQKKQVKGVTGNIEFQENGDRLNPPTEIVAVKWNAQQQKWQWTIEGRIQNSEFRIQE